MTAIDCKIISAALTTHRDRDLKIDLHENPLYFSVSNAGLNRFDLSGVKALSHLLSQKAEERFLSLDISSTLTNIVTDPASIAVSQNNYEEIKTLCNITITSTVCLMSVNQPTISINLLRLTTCMLSENSVLLADQEKDNYSRENQYPKGNQKRAEAIQKCQRQLIDFFAQKEKIYLKRNQLIVSNSLSLGIPVPVAEIILSYSNMSDRFFIIPEDSGKDNQSQQHHSAQLSARGGL